MSEINQKVHISTNHFTQNQENMQEFCWVEACTSFCACDSVLDQHHWSSQN